jgi:glutathione S-transferase
MILYHSLTSPYARKVRVLLLEKKLPFEPVNVAESARPVSEHNPLGKVPTLLLDDGTVLFDSSVISETLEALYPSPALLPADVRARALVRRWKRCRTAFATC